MGWILYVVSVKGGMMTRPRIRPPCSAKGNIGRSSLSVDVNSRLPESDASFRSQLLQWVDAEVVEPLVRELDASEALWQSQLSQHGWRLTSNLTCTSGSLELSIFDRTLPEALRTPQAVASWEQRQQLESYLIHPRFGRAQRHYILERLREWRSKGILQGMRCDFRANNAAPTDTHILEHIAGNTPKMLNGQDFGSRFTSSTHAPPVTDHLGQVPAIYLRQLTS